ncbi:MAG: DUF2950 domain-containing protein [Burkholderiales bacterium]|nr:DUF2950 domain-containing protein [Burkholderiales bacterium]
MKPFSMINQLRRMALLLLLLLPLASAAAGQRTYPTPEAAVDALGAALKANDGAQLIAIFGDEHKNLIGTGDPAHDAKVRADAAAMLSSFHVLEERGSDRRVLLMGAQAWPMPIPLLREGGVWRFATEEGVDELLNRRIGANERNAIHVLRAYLEAQRQYASRDRNADGVLQYARKLASAPGKQDGLYWAADAAKGEEASPFGPLIAASSPYLEGHKKGDPYRGYHFRILTRQGKDAPGGAYSYVINGRMIAGFAMLAYPHQHGETGIMSFIVSHNGKVYEKDLGTDSAGIGEKMTTFDPGAGWKEVAP